MTDARPNRAEASVLPSARAFARRGFAVFPAHWPISHRGRLICSCGRDRRGMPCTKPAKHPFGRLCPNGVYDATTDEDQIRELFREAPQANLGVHADGLIVVDTDPRDGGDESIRALEREHGEFPATWQSLTGSGGDHRLFTCPAGVEVKNVVAKQMDNPPLGPGIDIRTRGGYFIAPPSRHISGRSYAWSVDHHPQDVPLAPAPDWLIARLTTRTAATPSGAPAEPIVWAQLTRQPITAYHDMADAKIAGHLLRRWVDPYLVAGLLHAWNRTYAVPPLPDDELRRILDRVARLEDQRRDMLQGGEHAKG
jgi:Bifunctional DNA primase/polymerase, N-terminal